jgi:hypothetical protein
VQLTHQWDMTQNESHTYKSSIGNYSNLGTKQYLPFG